jgi:chromosome segregation ATPase
MKSQQTELETSLKKEKSRIDRLKGELAQAMAQKEAALVQIDQLKKLDAQRIESVEIAAAAFTAAERREAKMKTDLETTLAEVARLRRENESLRLEAGAASAAAAASTATAATITPISSDNLTKEVNALKEQIRSLKLKHVAELRSLQRKADKELEELESQYEHQIQAMEETTREEVGASAIFTAARLRNFFGRIRKSLRRVI